MPTRQIKGKRWAVTGVPRDSVEHFLPKGMKATKIITASIDPYYHIVHARKIRKDKGTKRKR